jgi:hypothetical protein
LLLIVRLFLKKEGEKDRSLAPSSFGVYFPISSSNAVSSERLAITAALK